MVMVTAACQKDSSPPVVPEDVGLDGFVIGDPANATLLVVDDTIKGAVNIPRTRNLDVDQDGQTDIRIVLNCTHTLGTGYRVRAYIAPEHPDAGLTGFYTNDSTFTSTSYTFINSSASGYSVERRQLVRSSCRPLLDGELVSVTSNRTRLKTFSPGELLALEETFIADSVRLVSNISSSLLNYHGVVNDTLYTSQYVSSINCNAFPQGQPNYIGFRVQRPEDTILGWIKFSIISDEWIALHQVAVRN
jgi:hypothetical protein